MTQRGPELTIRALTEADAEASRRLGFEAFGVPSTPPSDAASLARPGTVWFGAFDGETLAARMVDRDYDSYYGGASIPTSGIAGVTVALEYRTQGALSPLFAETLSHAKARGATISTLFPTAPRIYRGFGYEVVGDYVTVEVPTQTLAAVGPGGRLTTRRARVSDFDAIRAVYDGWAREQNGPLSRRGASFTATADEFLESFTGVTVAVDDSDGVQGFASWERGQGYGETGSLHVSDLLATGADGYRALLAAMGSFASVTPVCKIDTSGGDLTRMFLPTLHWKVIDSSPYMLKVLDVCGAVSARRYPEGASVDLAFTLAGDFLSENDGDYLLSVASGRGTCFRGDRAGRVLTARGLALLFAGAQSSANLRAAGHLTAGETREDLVWDALFGGRQCHIRDYF